MPIAVILAAAAVALSLPLLWWSVAGARANPSRAVAQNLGAGRVTDLRHAILTRSATDRAVRPTVRSLTERARRLTPTGFVDALERRLVLAGRPAAWPLERVLAAKILLCAGGLTLGVFLYAGHRSGRWLLLAVGLTALGYFGPDLQLWSRGRERQATIRRELPDTLDQMTISVEAGLGFESAMARAARTGKGPLAQELVRTLQEIQIGVPRPQAFRNLASRTTVGDLRHFVLAVIQAETYGIPIADVLRTQAGEQRVKRRQRAEEQAMKIPVKIIFPLVLCILPTLFIVIIGPAAIQISRSMFSG
ncbi:MAG: type II secretion system F family protein [Actinomycetota bacterium]|nr:type II secretion system F family protein [Actinomycetota bacterium]